MTVGPRPALAARDGSSGRPAGRPGARRLLRDGRPRARVPRSGRDGHRPGLLRRRCSSAPARRRPELELGLRATRSLCPSRTTPSTRPRSASACATSRDLERGLASCARVLTRAAASRSSRSRAPRACSRPSTASGSTASSRWSARSLPGGSAYSYLPASVRRFPDPPRLAKLMDDAGFDESAGAASPAGSSRCTRGSPGERARDGPRRARARRLPRASSSLGSEGGRRALRARRRRSAPRRSRPAASACGRSSSSSRAPDGEPAARGRRRDRARAHGDASSTTT